MNAVNVKEAMERQADIERWLREAVELCIDLETLARLTIVAWDITPLRQNNPTLETCIEKLRRRVGPVTELERLIRSRPGPGPRRVDDTKEILGEAETFLEDLYDDLEHWPPGFEERRIALLHKLRRKDQDSEKQNR